MPTLEFKGKQFVYAHHLTVPFRPLVIDEKKSLVPKGVKPTLATATSSSTATSSTA